MIFPRVHFGKESHPESVSRQPPILSPPGGDDTYSREFCSGLGDAFSSWLYEASSVGGDSRLARDGSPQGQTSGISYRDAVGSKHPDQGQDPAAAACAVDHPFKGRLNLIPRRRRQILDCLDQIDQFGRDFVLLFVLVSWLRHGCLLRVLDASRKKHPARLKPDAAQMFP